ncbi:MAG: endonuclease/exonuclease/phosphatase family protein [Labilithrix sp.]|nr:endonuclease/exonuclease/phosphatase family protein [Labilithrix sp.]
MIALGAACDSGAHPARLGESRSPLSEVPGPTVCNEGIGPGECKTVAVPTASFGHALDGVRQPLEYYGALRLPLANLVQMRTGGEVLVTLDPDMQTLRIFASNIPVSAATPTLAFFVDGDRFASGTNVSTADIGIEVTPSLGTATRLRPTSWGWEYDSESYEAVSVFHGSTTDIELELDVSSMVVGGTSDEPALGLAVALGGGEFPLSGALPERVFYETPAQPFYESYAFRPNFLTLLFEPTLGVPLSVATWNVHRFSPFMRTVLSLPNAFDDSTVPVEDVGDALATYDIVGLQELWDPDQALALIAAANARRATLSAGDPDRYLPGPYYVYGPPNHPPNVLGQTLGTSGFPDNSSDGGTYILSVYPFAATDYKVYDSCRGEDCYKAKGVQWARIALGAPNAKNQDCRVLDSEDGEIPDGCRDKPSGDLFIDVFNTHLHAEPAVCEAPALLAQLAAAMTFAPVQAPFFGLLAQSEFYCAFRTNNGVRRDQLDQLAGFVDAHADRRRPALIMGDLNVNGATGAEAEYSDMLTRLGMGTAAAPIPLNDWPTAYTWDIDMPDLAVEQGALPAITSPGSAERLDYILAKVYPEGRDYETAHFALRRKGFDGFGGNDPVWSTIPTTLSDHQLVGAELSLTQLFVPGRYHPTWPHEVTFRVVSQDSTGISDCWGCGQLDTYAWITGFRVDPAENLDQRTHFKTSECTDRWTTHVNTNACMHGWYWSSFDMTPPNDNGRPWTGHRFEVALWDHDTTSGDDHLPVMSAGNDAAVSIDWPTGAITMRSVVGDFPAGWTDFTLTDLSPVQRCTRTARANVCWELTVLEATPVLQHKIMSGDHDD